jgi:hypothetical protein
MTGRDVVGRRYGVMTARWGWQPVAWLQDGLPTWSWRCAPAGLVTRRQMRARGLAPGGAVPVGQVVCRRGARWAYLYDPAELVAKRVATPAQWVAVATAIAARRWCPTGGHYVDYCVPTSLGECIACHYREPVVAGGENREHVEPTPGMQSVPGVQRAHAALAWLRQRQARRQHGEPLERRGLGEHTESTERVVDAVGVA